MSPDAKNFWKSQLQKYQKEFGEQEYYQLLVAATCKVEWTIQPGLPWDLSYPNFVREPLLDDVRPFFGPREVLGTHH